MRSGVLGGRHAAVLTTLILVSTFAGCATYRNPVSNPDVPAGLADPFVLLVGNTYHAWGSNLPLRNPTDNVPHLTSTDLVHWTRTADALPTLPSWARPGATWAPGVLVRSYGAPYYVLYFTAVPVDPINGTHCLGTAISAHPEGPFTANNTPLVCQADHRGAIDPSPFVTPGNTDNRAAYLFWKSEDNTFIPARHTNIWSQPLSQDGQAFLAGSRPAIVLTASSNWEHGQVEAPAMVQDPASGRYILFYSGHYWYNEPAYSTGWATCPLTATGFGACTRGQANGWITSTSQVCAPSGAEVFTDTSGFRWLAYQSYMGPADPNSGKCVGVRRLRIDKLCFSAGVPRTNAPSTTDQPLSRSADCRTEVP
jgi:beta-xylosidase